MASLIQPLAISGARDSLGAVVAGGRVYLTVPGAVNTAVTAYTDADQSSAVSLDSGGYLLDSGGRAQLFVSSPCSVRIDNSAGVTVGTFTYGGLTADNLVEVTTPGWTGINSSGSSVSGARTYLDTVLGSLYTSLGGLDGKYRGTYGINDTNVKTEIEQFGLTPQRFGAKGDGVTDDTNAFLLMAAAQLASNLPILLPKGTYKISSTIGFGPGVVMNGVGAATATGVASVVLCTNATQSGFTFSPGGQVNGPVLSNFSILSNVATTGTGIAFSSASKATATNVTIAGVSGGSFTSAISSTGGGTAITCAFSGLTNAIVSGVWLLVGGSTSGAVVAGTIYAAFTSSSLGNLYANGTTDVASAGTAVIPTAGAGQVAQFHRVRMSSAGVSTATVTPPSFTQQQELVLDLNNTSNAGGGCTFTLSAPFKSTAGTAAPAASQRIVIKYVWSVADAVWLEVSRTASFAGTP